MISVPDICAVYPHDVAVLEPLFSGFGKKQRFGGEIVTIKCFEDNSLVGDTVRSEGRSRVIVVDGGCSLRRALLGDLLAGKAAENGWEGLLINGCVRDVEILASPKVMVLSGQSALIQTVEEIPYTELSDSTQGAAGLTSTEFKEVGVTLDVSVLITDEQKIRLTVSPEQSVDTGRTGVDSDNTTPIIDIRRLKTTLLMEDSQVAVLGGLRRRNLKNSIDKIPLLGDLPLVGFLFSNDNIEIEHTELVVFLSPHIYKGEPLTEREMEQFNELKNSPAPEFQEHKRPEFEFTNDVFSVIN